MEDAALHREVQLAIAAARAASDEEQGALLDRTDLQRIIGRLCSTLRKVDSAYSDVTRDRRDLYLRLRRGPIHDRMPAND